MYLVSMYEKDGLVEASLGGRVTADEIRVFGEELLELVAEFEERPFTMLIDHSRSKRLDGEAVLALAAVKDRCIEAGATRIVCVPIDEDDQAVHETARLQQVLEGSEEFVLEARRSELKQAAVEVTSRRAA